MDALKNYNSMQTRSSKMDDLEYYSKMRKQYSHIPETFSKKQKNKKDEEETFRSWSVNLGHDDAEMLDEKSNQMNDKAIENQNEEN